jgi:hypothetical protein
MSTATVDAPPSHLLDQPNEVLHMIVGFLPQDSYVKFVDQDGIKRKISQYLVLAQVCKRLRMVVLVADFWQDPDFSFLNLLEIEEAPRGHWARRERKKIKVGGLMKALLDDENVVNCLKRRKSWRFRDLQSLLILVTSASWFLQSTEEVQLCLPDRELRSSLTALSFCRQIKRLDINFTDDCEDLENDPFVHIDLDLIAECLPNVRKLKIEFGDCKGSLAGLKNLTDLALVFRGDMAVSDDKWGCLLPLSSQNTLTSLTIDDVISIPVRLNSFSNLTYLTLGQLHEEIVTTLKYLTNVKLHTLRIQLWDPNEIYDLDGLADSECLTKLKQLHLKFQSLDRYDEDDMQVISGGVISFFGISHLQTLEHLRLECGFDLAWCPSLASLTRLKCLQLGIVKTAIGRTIGGKFFGMEEVSELQSLKKNGIADGMNAILEKEFEWVPKMKILYVDDDSSFPDCFPMDDFSCLCESM